MKETFDDKLVPSRCYYYLLDFNQADKFQSILAVEPLSEGRLCYLTEEQFWKLWDVATKKDKNKDW